MGLGSFNGEAAGKKKKPLRNLDAYSRTLITLSHKLMPLSKALREPTENFKESD